MTYKTYLEWLENVYLEHIRVNCDDDGQRPSPRVTTDEVYRMVDVKIARNEKSNINLTGVGTKRSGRRPFGRIYRNLDVIAPLDSNHRCIRPTRSKDAIGFRQRGTSKNARDWNAIDIRPAQASVHAVLPSSHRTKTFLPWDSPRKATDPRKSYPPVAWCERVLTYSTHVYYTPPWKNGI